MSNLKEWVEDRQENGDDGTGYEEEVGTCSKCNAWDDCLESGVCQTCIKEVA